MTGGIPVGTGGSCGISRHERVFGRFFNVSPIEMFDSAAYAAVLLPTSCLDDQTHLSVQSQRGHCGRSPRDRAGADHAGLH
jgi:hypothetical protein